MDIYQQWLARQLGRQHKFKFPITAPPQSLEAHWLVGRAFLTFLIPNSLRPTDRVSLYPSGTDLTRQLSTAASPAASHS